MISKDVYEVNENKIIFILNTFQSKLGLLTSYIFYVDKLEQSIILFFFLCGIFLFTLYVLFVFLHTIEECLAAIFFLTECHTFYLSLLYIILLLQAII